MGGKQSFFTQQEMDDYKKLTYLNEKEILKCVEKFRLLARKGEENLSEIDFKNVTITKTEFLTSTDISANPFADRIFKVFANHNDAMSFDDYLNMMSVFAEAAPTVVKSRYAFEIYDFGDLNYLRRKDIETLILRLVGKSNRDQISAGDMKRLVDKIFEEADIDQNNKITTDEFEHIVTKSTDFAKFLLILKMSSTYAKRMAQLSARIFGQLMIEKNTPNGRLIQRLAQKPIDKMEEYSMNYYPRHQEHDHLFKVLRYHGLYRDEHRDFIEEIERLKKLRGKGKRERKLPGDEAKK